MRKELKKIAAVILTTAITITTAVTGTSKIVKADEKAYPWTKTEASTTGNYIIDSYIGIEKDNVFENVTQERLKDILSSQGNYYIVFAGPEHKSSQKVIKAINEQAKADGITKIYHFDPYIDGYQLDITDENSIYKAGRGKSIYELWTSIKELLPNSEIIDEYNGEDTLLLAFSNDRANPQITASYELKENDEFDEESAKKEIAKVFRAGDEENSVVLADERSDFEFFKRVYNGSATYINYNNGEETANKTGKETELFTDADKEGFSLHQVTFPELLDILNSDGDNVIFFGASWCHNTQAIIESVAKRANKVGKTVYVYDTTLGNQLTFGTGDEIDKVLSGSSVFNSRNNVNIENGYNNISYVYGELVKYFGNFITENNSKKNNSITYYPNGDLNGELTNVAPWEGDNTVTTNAKRLQMPFLVSYNKNEENPITKQWIHKNAANDGTYTEYMLDLTWVLGTQKAKEAVDRNGNPAEIDGLSYVEFAKEAVNALDDFFGVKIDENKENESEETKNEEQTTANQQSTTLASSQTNNQTTDKNETSVPAKTKVKTPVVKVKVTKKLVKITWNKISNAKGYEIFRADKKKGKYKKVKSVAAKKRVYVNNKLKKKKYYYKVRSFAIDEKGKKVYSGWSKVKTVTVK